MTDAEIRDRANVLPVDLVEAALGMPRVVGGTRMPCGPTRDEISSAREKIAALIGRRRRVLEVPGTRSVRGGGGGGSVMTGVGSPSRCTTTTRRTRSSARS